MLLNSCRRSVSSSARNASNASFRSAFVDVAAACFSRVDAASTSRRSLSGTSAEQAVPADVTEVEIRNFAATMGTSPLMRPTIQIRSVFQRSGLRSLKPDVLWTECLVCSTAMGSPFASKLTPSSVSTLTEKSPSRLCRTAHSNATRTW